MTDAPLPGFEDFPVPELEEIRTHAQRVQFSIDCGVHPRTKLPLADNGKTCGDCAMLWHKSAGNGSWWKCSMPGRGDGPDMTKRWPACTAFKEKQ